MVNARIFHMVAPHLLSLVDHPALHNFTWVSHDTQMIAELRRPEGPRERTLKQRNWKQNKPKTNT